MDELRQFVVGPLPTNCYAYISDGVCMVVDPGFAGDQIAQALSDVKVRYVVATHGHGDHVGGVSELVAATGATFMMSEADVALAQNMDVAGNHPGETQPPLPDKTLAAEDIISFGTARFKVLETPGHTKGGIVLVGEGSAKGVAFVGDTLFAGSAGRTDLMGGNPVELTSSLQLLIRALPADTTILSGHGRTTTMEEELATNPFLVQLQ